jgi:methyl-accepting chemotaxis protein
MDELQHKSDDEVGDMAVAMHTMSVSLRGVLREIADSAPTLSRTSSELAANSGEIANHSREASDKAHAVAAAA